MTNKTTTFSAPSKTKIKRILLIIVLVALACYFVPLPIPRWQAMTCHEMGHSLGLDHNTTTTSIMQPNTVDYYDYRDGDPNIKTPRVVDRAGMNAIYS